MTTIGVVGLGLIGGSVALAARRAGHHVLAWDSDPATREAATDLGLTLDTDLSGAELIVLALPMPALADALPATLSEVELDDTATITDVGSLKVPVAEAFGAAGLAQRHVGGHPMAGTEHTGFPAADPELFRGATWALCLNGDESDVARWLQVAATIIEVGAGVVAMTPAEHDAAMATVSGLPHLLALALSATAADAGPLLATLAAGSFADLTRVAASDPALLHAVIDSNEPAVRMALRRLLDQLDRPWPDVIRDGGTAREWLSQRRIETDQEPPRAGQTVSLPGELLALGRAGAVIEAVDPASGTVRYRPTPEGARPRGSRGLPVRARSPRTVP